MGNLENIIIGWRSALMFAVCLPIVIIAIMLMLRSVETTANRCLAGFLLIAVIAQIPQVIGFAGFYTVWPGLTFAPFSVEWYAGPLLYLHAHSLMKGSPFGWRLWLLLPGILQTAYYTSAFTMLGDYRAKWDYTEAFHLPYIDPVETAVALGLMAFAIWRIFQMNRVYRVFLENTQSAAEFRPTWLPRLLLAIVVAGVLLAVLELMPLLLDNVSFIDVYPPQILLTAVVAWLGFQALVQTTTAFPKMSGQESAADGRLPSAPAEVRDWVSEGDRIAAAAREGRWYLESRLSIKEVASRLATNETYVSRALNRGLKVSFNRFVNDLRVAHAQGLILEGSGSLLDIANASGFNSKATFNRVFRELAGQTPSQFKRSQKP
ncbi:MAG: helix-turn-helix domain-containing protein [Woeseiaceae bacterium]